MTAYERDYIGSADAYRVFSGRYRALIESKADDTGFMDARMSRGLTLEHDIVLEAIDGFRCPTLFQERFTHPDPALHYCKATCDGVLLEGDDRTVIEAKTSEKDAPKDEAELLRGWPEYWYQVQWQLWVTGAKMAYVAWCKCPPIGSYEPCYDGDGRLSVSRIRVMPKKRVFKAFERNAPEFWAMWEDYKALMDTSGQGPESLGPQPPAGLVEAARCYAAAVAEEDAANAEIERVAAGLILSAKAAKERASAMREALTSAMREAGVKKYETDALTVTYVAPSTRRVVDTALLRKAGVYERYTKEQPVSDSVRITVRPKDAA